MRWKLVFVFLVTGAGAGAEEIDDETPPTMSAGYAQGLVTPFTISAYRPETALVIGDGGYNGATKSGVFDVAAELHLWGPIYLRGGGSYIGSSDTFKPLAGAL